MIVVPRFWWFGLFILTSTCWAFSPPQFSPVKVESPYTETLVHSILEDKDGFIWFATVDGLCFYDGYDFKFYRKGDRPTESLSSNVIRDIVQDQDGYIWIATQDAGLNRFDKEQETFDVFNIDDDSATSFRADDAWKVFVDREGTLWIGTWITGMFKFEGVDQEGKFQFKQFLNDPSNPASLSHNIVREIYEDTKGRFWIGTQGGGLNLFDPEAETFRAYRHDPDDPTSLAHDGVYALMEDSAGTLWVGTNGGSLCSYDEKSESFRTYFDIDSRYVTALLEVEPGYLLVGTESGLRYFDIRNEIFVPIDDLEANPKASLSRKLIRSLYKDSHGIIWVGTESGVYKQVVAKQFEHFKNDPKNPNSLNYNTVRSILETPDGVLWVGTLGLGVNRFDPDTGDWAHYTVENSGLKDNVIVSLGNDRSGSLWAGTMNGYIQRFKRETQQFEPYLLEKNPVNTPNMVQCIVEDENGTLWVGSENGLCRFDPSAKSFSFVRHNPDDPHSLSGDNIQSRAVVFDKKGDLWVGTFGWGLNRIPKDQLYRENPKVDRWAVHGQGRDKIGSDNIIAIHLDADDDTLWLGTYGGGVFHLDPDTGRVRSVNGQQGLSNNVVYAILEDEDGHLWCSTQNGLNRVNKHTLECRVYTDRDGLQSNTFFWGSAFKSTTGWMYFGGHNGFNRFKPEAIVDNMNPPPVYITDFRVTGADKQFDRGIYVTEKINLAPEENFFTVQFSALDYSDPQRNQYRYQLEGIDRDWVESGNKQTATYTNVPPGTYRFRVVGSNNDQIWNTDGATLTITVEPTFFQTRIFRALVILIVMAFVLWIFRLRFARMEIQQSLLREKVQERTKELDEANQQLSAQFNELQMHRSNLEKLVDERTTELKKAKEKAEESDKLKSSFLANMSHEIRTPLNAIVGFSSLLTDASLSMEERDDYIEMISENSNLLVLLVDDILDLSKIEAGQLKVSFQTFSAEDLLDEIVSYWTIQHRNPDLAIETRNELTQNQQLMVTDPFRLKQILNNLMSNAVKFTEKGRIELSLCLNNGWISFAVSDTGIGISKESQSMVFERFTKIEASGKVLYRGSGLGLAISKRLAHLLGGDLLVESEPGVGSVFTLQLPLSVWADPDISDLPAQRFRENRTFQQEDWRQKSILVAEDEDTNFKLLQVAIDRTDASITRAKDGREAVDLVDKHDGFDVVLMDIKMPRMDGYQALSRIKRINPKQVVIAQTAYATPEDKQRLNKAGFDAVLPKPIDLKELYAVISKYMR
jgi:signal transduction histidine kinase/ligand-binding sensor domain-containing protein